MDLTAISLFATADTKMNWLTARQKMVAENVAQADTPGYEAKDLRPLRFDRQMAALRRASLPEQTDAMHLAGSNQVRGHREDRSPEIYEVAPSGNEVTLEQEMLKAAEIQREHQLATTLVKRHVAMLRSIVA